MGASLLALAKSIYYYILTATSPFGVDGLFILSFARMEGAEINTTYGENSAVRRTFKAYNKTERPLLSFTWEALNQGNYSGELQQT